ncbi:hypothetical protein L1887_47634 [Cichorium endivia]|nr:hypothetical protein L1887_47634 [Cichorium endivia]
MSWKRYADRYLGKPVPPFIVGGEFHPQHAIAFQQRILSLNTAKKQIVRTYRALYKTEHRAMPRVRFSNWSKLAQQLSPRGASIILTSRIRALADDDIARMRRIEETLRGIIQ